MQVWDPVAEDTDSTETRCLRRLKVDIPQCEGTDGRDTQKERDMPQIIVAADRGAAFGEGAVTFRETVNVADFESQHFATQLVERLGWAVEDADQAEQVSTPHKGEPTPPEQKRTPREQKRTPPEREQTPPKQERMPPERELTQPAEYRGPLTEDREPPRDERVSVPSPPRDGRVSVPSPQRDERVSVPSPQRDERVSVPSPA
jgi:hypothetical protein